VGRTASWPAVVGWTVAITAPVAAGVAVAIDRMRHRPRSTVRLVAEQGIHNVGRPALWREQTGPVRTRVELAAVPPVPPENPHAPPTPATGIPRQPA
jgi:hypothetical protein